MTVRLLHTADWHLGCAFGAFGEAAARRREDQTQTIARLIDLAIAERVDAVLLSGDLFDSTRPDAAALALATRALDRLAEQKIPAFATAGTHDHLGVESARPVFGHGNLFWFERPACERPIRLACPGGALWLYGLSAPAGRAAELETLRRRPGDGAHVGLLHGSVIYQPGLAVAQKDVPVTPAELAALNLDYVALGHYHGFREIRAGGRLLGAYSGAPEALRYADDGPRHVLLVTLAADGPAVEARPINSGTALDREIDAAAATDDAALIRQLAALGGSTVYARVRLRGLLDDPLDVESLHEQAASQFAWLELLDETEISPVGRLADLARETSVRGRAFAKLLNRLAAETDPARRRVLQRALSHLAVEFERRRGMS
jgi:DNA repair exonuclease SbcCD nuclease subunit